MKTKLLSIAIVFLVGVLTLSIPLLQVRSAQSDLLSLPAKPYSDNNIQETPARALLLSVSQQTISASPDQLISFSITYQAFASLNHNNSLEIDQLFFVESWTSSWPPNGYTISVYNGIPGLYPGRTETKTISFTAPTPEGTYYLWFCYDDQYTMQDAVNLKTQSMSGLPGHIKVVVGTPQLEIPYWAWMALATSIVLAITTATFASTTVYFHRKATVQRQSLTAIKSPSKRDSKVCPNCGANLPSDSRFCGKCGTSLE